MRTPLASPNSVHPVSRAVLQDDHDPFELFNHYFHKQPLYVYKGNGLHEDAVYTAEDEAENANHKKVVERFHENLKVVVAKVKELFNTTEDPIISYRIDGPRGNNTACIVLKDKEVLIRYLLLVGKKTENLYVYASGATDDVVNYVGYLIDLYPTQKRKDNTVNIISQDGSSGFYMTSVSLEKRQHKFDLANYNDNFADVSKHIIKNLKKENDSGIVLLHGSIGTGKTTFLKHLLRAVGSKQLIYMPPDMIEHISSPSFVTFLISRGTNSVLLIEDAENVLKTREAGGSQAVSNILNISDGILGDVLKIQLVCTFNCPRDHIDSALLRPGRLIAEYRFDNLTAAKTAALMKKLYGEDVEYKKEEMSLAEIYNFKDMPHKSPDKPKIGMGFTSE